MKLLSKNKKDRLIYSKNLSRLMGDILDLIKSRRTIKYFLPKYVSHELIFRIIDAGRHAPSSGNIQNWKFIVAIDEALKLQLAEAAHEQYEISGAPLLIIICAEPEKAQRYYGLRGERLFTIQNCAAAAQNMILEAESLGLGTRWIGAFDEEEVKAACGIPENVRPQVMLAVGYPKELPKKPPKYPLETVTYFNSWRGKMRDSAKYMHDTATILARKFNAIGGAGKSVVDKTVDSATKIFKKKDADER